MNGIVDLLFYPVGQGLFAAGAVVLTGGTQPFTWVYDCGSTSSIGAVRIERSLDLLEQKLGPRNEIDLLVLSHFDSDHISGVARLLSRFRVVTLLIPLVPLWQRLAIHFERAGYESKQTTQFQLDPVGSLRSLPGVDIRRIILVPPSDGDGPPPDGDEQVPLPPLPGDPDRRTIDDNVQAPSLRASARLREVSEASQPGHDSQLPVYELPAGGRLTWQSWEFVPYNDAVAAIPAARSFIADAESRRRSLLAAGSQLERRNALGALKRHYEQVFKSSRKRNEISLFLFSGLPHRPHIAMCYRCNCSAEPVTADFHWPCLRTHDGPGVLYTGDGFLNTAEHWNRLARYLGPARLHSLLAFQVMHHGAAANWHPGLASHVPAPYAIFSADPRHKRFRHPHRPVLEDFRRNSQIAIVNDAGLRLFSCFRA